MAFEGDWASKMPKDCEIIIHSSVNAMGGWVDLQAFIMELTEAVGGLENSTLLMPTFTFEFKDTKYSNPETSISESGLLTETFRKMQFEGRRRPFRTENPMQSVAIVGKSENEYKRSCNKTSFGPGSVFDLLYERDGYGMLLGVVYNRCTFYHYVEQKCQVPYRFWKEFHGVIEANGKKREVIFRNYVRDLSYKCNINHYGLLLEEWGLVHRFNIHNAIVRIFRLRDLHDLLYSEIRRDPYALTHTARETWELNTTTTTRESNWGSISSGWHFGQ